VAARYLAAQYLAALINQRTAFRDDPESRGNFLRAVVASLPYP